MSAIADARKSGPKTIVIDFDGVIHGYSQGWKDGTIYDPPKSGAKQGLQRLKDAGHRLIIFSTRAFTRTIRNRLQISQASDIRMYMDKYNLPYDEIYQDHGKPLGHVYLDDRGVRFLSWGQAVDDITRILEDE